MPGELRAEQLFQQQLHRRVVADKEDDQPPSREEMGRANPRRPRETYGDPVQSYFGGSALRLFDGDVLEDLKLAQVDFQEVAHHLGRPDDGNARFHRCASLDKVFVQSEILFSVRELRTRVEVRGLAVCVH